MRSGWKDERGQALLMTALSLGMIFGILGLTADVGWAYYRQRAAQAAAEAAAIAAVRSAQTLSATFTCGTDLECPATATACPSAPISSTLSPSYNSIQIGCYYAYLDGFSQGGSSGAQSVTMAAGTGKPTTVSNVSTEYWVTARVSESIPQLFSAINSGNNSLNAGARATAGLIQTTLPGCVYALKTTPGTTDFDVSGDNFTAANCNVYANSNATISGSNVTVNSINVSGAYSAGGSNVTATVNQETGADYPDPLASLPAPTDPNGTNCIAGTGGNQINTTSMVTISGSAGRTLYPGNYCGGINIQGSTNIVFSPGTYFIAGGLTMSGSNLSGSGVMFDITPIGLNAAGGVSISGNNATFSAATSGTYEGVLFFENRSSSVAVSIQGSNTNLTGDLYFYGSNVTYGGSNNSDVAVISQTVTVSGTNFGYTPVTTGAQPSAPPQVVLIE